MPSKDALPKLRLKASLNSRRAVIQSVVAMVSSGLLASSGLLFPAFFFALAFVRGFSVAFFENNVAKVVENSKNVSADIGWLHVPMRISEFLSVLMAGYLAQTLGYAPVFAVTGVFFVIFSFMSIRVLSVE